METTTLSSSSRCTRLTTIVSRNAIRKLFAVDDRLAAADILQSTTITTITTITFAIFHGPLAAKVVVWQLQGQQGAFVAFETMQIRSEILNLAATFNFRGNFPLWDTFRAILTHMQLLPVFQVFYQSPN